MFTYDKSTQGIGVDVFFRLSEVGGQVSRFLTYADQGGRGGGGFVPPTYFDLRHM